MKTVHAPQSDYSGVSAGVIFIDGVGYTDHPGALAYFEANGYTVTDGGTPHDLPPQSVQPRAAAQPASRDAAVNPDAGGPVSDAFLPPVNAGQDDPHGPEVVSPGLHATPPAPIVPGPVSSDPAEQEAAEQEAAEAALIDQEPVDEVVAQDDADRGPLGLSDPASVGQGPDAAVTMLYNGTGSPEYVQRVSSPDGSPAKSAPKAEWVEYAVAQGADRDEAEAATKADLVERYG